MNKKKITLVVAAILVVGAAVWMFWGPAPKNKVTYETAKVTKGNISNSVTATGTIEPVTEVEVGTQVSGIINKIYVDYLRIPKYIELTQDHLDSVVDNSPILEFSDYVCNEIIKEVKALVLENASDPRLQNIAISESIAPSQNTVKK